MDFYADFFSAYFNLFMSFCHSVFLHFSNNISEYDLNAAFSYTIITVYLDICIWGEFIFVLNFMVLEVQFKQDIKSALNEHTSNIKFQLISETLFWGP